MHRYAQLTNSVIRNHLQCMFIRRWTTVYRVIRLPTLVEQWDKIIPNNTVNTCTAIISVKYELYIGCVYIKIKINLINFTSS